MPCAVILTALSVEYLAVSAHLTDLQEETHPKGNRYERGKFTTEAQRWEVGIAQIGQGNHGVAFEVERAIDHFQPDVIFFVGVAGGIKDVALGDVVVPNQVYGYESGAAGEATFQPRPRVSRPDYALEQLAKAEANKPDWLQRLSAPTPNPIPNVIADKPIASGEAVIKSTKSEIFQLLQSNYGDAVAVEMEGFGFLEAARANHGVSALVIRGISDLIDNKTEADAQGYQEIASRHASAFAFELLAKLKIGTTGEESAPQPQNVGSSSIDELVQQVRSRLHDDIQRLHGTMPLWGVDHWVPLGDLFVDVNILEEVSSNRRSELADLWQDFNQNPSYRSLDRIGLGKEGQRVSGLAVLDKNTNLMLVGKPGSGKTTYLQRVVTECNAGNLQAHRIPVLIRLREFIEDGREVEYVVQRYLERYWRLSEAEVQSVLDAGRSLVLLDGLDEVAGEDGKAITKQIKRFARDYPQVQVIVTCRTQSFAGEMDWKSVRFSFVEVADFDEPQVRAFVKHWFQTICGDLTVGQAKAKAFLDQLFREENKPIYRLATTPILLSLTCAVFQQTGKFYSKRSKLYEEGLELLLEKWDESRGIGRYEIHPDFSPNKELELLSYLAVKKFEQEQYVLFEQAEIEGYIAEFLGIGLRESRGVLKAIASQHGLLIERSQKVWSFSHLTFQEYLIAKCFCNREKWHLATHITDTRWREVFLLTTEMLQPVDDLLRLMKLQIDELLGGDEKLQRFLTWVDGKAKSVNNPCKPAAIRALYCALDYCILEDTIDKALPLALTLDIKLHIALSPSLDLNIALSRAATWDIDLDSCKSLSLPCPSYLTLSSALARILNRDLTVANIGENDLKLQAKLDRLTHRLPKLQLSQKEREQWWKENGQAWADQLRLVMIEHRNIGHDWQFSDKQQDRLQQYYDANKLLVDCLCYGNRIVREQLEATLLLPIAEIEKRNREKVK
jgi:nucleoside phosphorylase